MYWKMCSGSLLAITVPCVLVPPFHLNVILAKHQVWASLNRAPPTIPGKH